MRFEAQTAITKLGYLENFCEHLFLTNNCEEKMVVKGLPKRMVFETKIWQIGEKLRTELKDKDKRTSILKNGILSIIKESKYQRGRESFVMLLHLFPQDDAILYLFDWLLVDQELYGFAIVELNKLGVPGFSEVIAGIYADEKTGWIRRAAKTYLTKWPRLSGKR